MKRNRRTHNLIFKQLLSTVFVRFLKRKKMVPKIERIYSQSFTAQLFKGVVFIESQNCYTNAHGQKYLNKSNNRKFGSVWTLSKNPVILQNGKYLMVW